MGDYLTERYRSKDTEKLLGFIEQFPLAMLISPDGGGAPAYLPLILDRSDESRLELFGHLDSSNPFVDSLDGARVRAVFLGPNGYISPTDYTTRQFPTWNYAAAEVVGATTLVKDETRKLAYMVRTVDHLEVANGSDYRLDESDPSVRAMVGLITFFTLDIESMTGVFKFSQDKSGIDRHQARESLVRKLRVTQSRALPRLADASGTDYDLWSNGTTSTVDPADESAPPGQTGPRRNVLEAIGDTPIVRLNRVASELTANVSAKLEFTNPGGSIKDRIGWWLLEDAERRGVLQPGGLVVEGTGGNTGIGLAMAAAVKGYRCVFTVPDKMSDAKVKTLRAFGAEVVVTPTVPPPDPRNYCEEAKRIVAQNPGSLYVDQYNNLANRDYHYAHTGPEILRQLPEIDVLVAGLGTGGTLCGAGRYLKEQKPELKVIGVDPVGSILYDMYKTGTSGPPQPYLIEGIGKDCVPLNIDFDLIDEVVQVRDREAFLLTRQVLREEGIFAGVSSGSALVGALRWMRECGEDLTGRNILVIFPDSGGRYVDRVYDDDWMRSNGLLDDEEDV